MREAEGTAKYDLLTASTGASINKEGSAMTAENLAMFSSSCNCQCNTCTIRGSHGQILWEQSSADSSIAHTMLVLRFCDSLHAGCVHWSRSGPLSRARVITVARNTNVPNTVQVKLDISSLKNLAFSMLG